MNPAVDEYLSRAKRWGEEMGHLRSIVLDHQLTEEVKWRAPCYTYEGTNVLMIGGFKDFCFISFLKGALLEDHHGLLVKTGENTQAWRQLRFTSVQGILDVEPAIREYVQVAIEAEKAGLKVELKPPAEHAFVEELDSKLAEDAAFRTAFKALTPGRQRAYNLHFSGAKQSATRVSRIEKCMPRIFDGFGLNDCTCGLSKRKPNCDGSHKSIR